MGSWDQNALSKEQKIGAVTGHELYHAIKEPGRKLTREEHQKAYDAESTIIKEFGVRNRNVKK
jgi:hypothetical protein